MGESWEVGGWDRRVVQGLAMEDFGLGTGGAEMAQDLRMYGPDLRVDAISCQLVGVERPRGNARGEVVLDTRLSRSEEACHGD